MRLRHVLPLAAAALGLAAGVAGCGGGDGAAGAGGRLGVVATTTQLGDFARAVGGSDARVAQILQPNSDPHEYEPRPDDVRAVGGATVVLESGDDLDRWMAGILRQGGGDPTVVDLARSNVEREPGETSGAEASRYDPHWWHDPRNAEAAVRAIAVALGRADPDHAAAYTARARAYAARIARLDRGIARCMATVPAGRRKLVTDHDAFTYFARRYGITVVGAVIPSQTTQAQTSAKDVAALTRLIRREHVRAVFPETSVNPKLARAIASQSGATADAELYGDTLGPRGSAGATYLGMEAHNADAMVRGFTGGARGCPGLPT